MTRARVAEARKAGFLQKKKSVVWQRGHLFSFFLFFPFRRGQVLADDAPACRRTIRFTVTYTPDQFSAGQARRTTNISLCIPSWRLE